MRARVFTYCKDCALRNVESCPVAQWATDKDGEIPGDDSGYWLGAWGKARVDEYLLTNNREWMVFKSDDDVFDVLERHLSDEEFEKLPETEEECRPVYNALPWTKAIIVYIQMPD